MQTVPLDRAAAVTSVVHEMLPRSIDRRISVAYSACSPSSHCVDCIYSLVPGKLCNLMVHDAEDRTHIWTGTDNLGALELLCSLTPSCALGSPLPRSDRSAIHRTPCVHAFARFSNIPASQRRVGQCGRESGSCDHRQQLASGVAGRNSALTHQWTHVPAVKLGILLLECNL